MSGAARWIDRDDALTRLGVKSQTLYAYVSRGRITARPDPSNPRRSLYADEDITRLTGAPAGPETGRILPFDPSVGKGPFAIRSSQTLIEDGQLFYRGQDAVLLAREATIEDAARLLWDTGQTNPFAALSPRLDSVAGTTPRARMFAALARRAQEDGPSTGRDRGQLIHDAASTLTEVTDGVAGLGPRLQLHQRLGRGWRVMERNHPILRIALVLAADTDMDAAVIATRTAAGAGASLSAAALAGLATLSGSAQARDLTRIVVYVSDARRDPVGAPARRLTAGESLPGFGDPDWPDGDPRAAALIAASSLPADLATVAREGEAMTGQAPAFGLALALLARKLDLPRESALDLLLMGRLVGLLGHALDQVTDGSPIAARLRYGGPRPGAT